MKTELPAREQALFLIDVSSFIFRAFYAIRSLTNSKGTPTNAVYGVASMMAKLIQSAKPEYLKVVYDSKEPSFRKEMYAEYKANRSEVPDDLIPQFDLIEQLIFHMGIPSIRQSGVEADDLIGSLTKAWLAENPQHQVVIVTGDKDLMQLVDDRVCVWDTMKDVVFGPPEVAEKMGVPPEQVRDFLALVGDSSDNVPGVPGVGPKSAVDLLKEHETLEGVLAAAKAGKISGKKGIVIAENEKVARLSQELVSLKMDLAVPSAPAELRFQFQVTDEAISFLREMDFHTLIKQWSQWKVEATSGDGEEALSGGSSTGATSAEGVPAQWVCIQDASTLKEWVAKIKKTGLFSVDLETTSLNPRLAEIVGISLAVSGDCGAYIPVGHKEGDVFRPNQLDRALVLETLKPLLEDPRIKKIGQNLKYDFSVLSVHGIQCDGIGADTMVADYVLDPEGRHGLDHLASKHLSYSMLSYEEVCGKGKDQIGFDQVTIETATRYSAEDAWAAFRLWEKLLPELSAEGLLPVLSEIDLPLVPVLMRMELQGICIDESYLQGLSAEFAIELESIEKKIAGYTSEPVNLNSPKQLAVLLFEHLKLPTQSKTKTGFSTDASVLEVLAPLHEVPKLLLEYREISKLKGTYVDPLPLLKDPKTGKIHSHFHQTVAATGRLSSSDPNLQNIPTRTERGRKIRRAFVASPGRILMSADYSQIELRILAHMSGDPALTEAFLSGADIHRRTAAEIFSVMELAVTEEMRDVAKAINFGLIYGKTAFGLAQELGISRKQAAEFIERYFKRYPKIKSYLDQAIQGARDNGWVETLAGRRRKLRDIQAKNPMIRANSERMAMNTPIQGTASDLMKIAMIHLDEKLASFQSKLIVQVHDEVLLDVVPSEKEAVEKVVRDCLVNAMKLKVPLTVNLSTGSNWMEL